MSNDGLSNTEKVNLLFKNYMNFTSTLDSKAFFEETALANNTNIFSTSVLSSTPSTSPNFNTTISNASDLSTLLVNAGITNISIDDTWFTSKTTDGGSFKKTSDNVTLRLDTIKLDYITNGGASFICKDNNGVNILQNLIPSNYAGSGYSLSLGYKTGGSIKSVPWLTARGTLGSILGTSVNFGGALFDSKNGVVTFYDVNGTPSSIFGSAEFYLTATKYIGPKGITSAPSLNVAGSASFDDTTESSNTTSGAVQIAGGLGIAKNTFIGGDASVTNDLNVGGDTTISGNLIVSGTTTTVNANTLDISDNATIDGKLIVKSDISLNGSMNTDGGAIIQGSVGIGTDSTPVKLTIVSTDAIKIPVGTSNQRPTSSGADHYGYIRYNTDLSSYEGFGAGNVWGSLGGIKDVDGDTYISAENSAGADNDQLKFFTANSQRMIIDSTGDASFNADVNVVGNLRIQQAATITGKLTAQNDASFNQALNVDGVTTLNSTLRVVGDATMDSNATIDGDLLVKSSGIVDNDLLVRRNLTVDGSINFLGEFIQKDTIIQVTEQMDLSNDGTGPALIVRQHGAQPVATFYDDASLSMIIKDGGDVSFNNSVCILQDLSVNGSISVTGGHGGTIAGALITGDDDARPTNPTVGTIRFNTDSEKQYAEIYASSWLQITTGEQLTRVDASVNRLYSNSDLDPEIITFDDDNFMHIARNGGGPDSVFRLSNDFEVSGNTIFKGDVTLNRNLIIKDDISLNGTMTVNGVTALKNNLTVTGDASFNTGLSVDGNLNIDGNTVHTGTTLLSNTVTVNAPQNNTGDLTLVGDLLATGDISLNGKIFATGDVSLNSKLNVGGDASFNSNVSIGGNFNVDQISTFTDKVIAENDISLNGILAVNGDASFNSNIAVNGHIIPMQNEVYNLGSESLRFKDLYLSGSSIQIGTDTIKVENNSFQLKAIDTENNATIGGDISLNGILAVNGDVSFNNKLNVENDATFKSQINATGNATFDNNVHIKNELTVDGSINFTGDFIKTDTIVRITEQMDLSNNGTGPALIVRQHGTGSGYHIAEFYDDTSVSTVFKDGGDVSFNESIQIGKNITVQKKIINTGGVIHQF